MRLVVELKVANLEEHLTWRWSWITITERIPGVTFDAATDWNVIHHITLSEQATGAWTGVPALLSHASLTRRTVGVHCALWSTAGRTANVILKTGA